MSWKWSEKIIIVIIIKEEKMQSRIVSTRILLLQETDSTSLNKKGNLMTRYGGASQVKRKTKDHTQEQETPEGLVGGTCS